MEVTVVGDVLLDVDIDGETTRLCPDAPVPVVDVATERYRAGGAGLVAAMLAGDGHDVVLVTVLSDDEAGRTLERHLGGATVVAGPSGVPTPVKTRVRAAGRPLLRYDQGCGPAVTAPVTAAMLRAIEDAAVILVSDYGRGLTRNPELRAALELAAARIPMIWDPHPNGAPPVPGADAVTPNLAEARTLAAALRDLTGGESGGSDGPGSHNPADARPAAIADALRRHWKSDAVLLTLGELGAVLAQGGHTTERVRAPEVPVTDPCGAGDRLAASLAVHRLRGLPLGEAAKLAVREAAAFLGRGGVGSLGPQPRPAPAQPALSDRGASGLNSGSRGTRDRAFSDPVALARQIQAAGGTVVATGGCFDLLHAGHARTLAAAAGLGDCLIVCLNSDSSVRRLKGPGRPILGETDRRELLASLKDVDAVMIFEEDTPEACLDELRPDVWVKGGDYDAGLLPEAPLVESWGGRCAIVPYHPVHSTTELADSLAKVG